MSTESTHIQFHMLVIKVFYPRPRLISDKSSQCYKDSASKRKGQNEGELAMWWWDGNGGNDEYSLLAHTTANMYSNIVICYCDITKMVSGDGGGIERERESWKHMIVHVNVVYLTFVCASLFLRFVFVYHCYCIGYLSYMSIYIKSGIPYNIFYFVV